MVMTNYYYYLYFTKVTPDTHLDKSIEVFQRDLYDQNVLNSITIFLTFFFNRLNFLTNCQA